MNVLLINPSWSGLVSKKAHLYNWAFPPLDLLNISSILKDKGININILDLRAKPMPLKELQMQISSADKIILTTSPLDRWQCPNIDLEHIYTITSEIKDKNKLIITGVHGTLYPELIQQKTGASIIIRGEPEKTIYQLFDNTPLENILGISYIRDGQLVSNKDQDLIDLNTLPIPDYNEININNYGYEFLGNKLAILQFSRGCPYNCIFCLKKMYGQGYRKKTSEKLIEEIDYVINKIGANSIYFYDLTFTFDKSSIHKICDLIIKNKYNFSWCCQTRAEMVDLDLLKNMKSAGCKLIHFGVESGSKKTSELLEKNISLENIQKGIAAVKQSGIASACFFMFGYPGETIEDMNETINFAIKLNPDYASFHIAIPYPGTKFYELTKSTEIFPEMYIKEHTEKDLKRVLRKAFTKFYFRPKYIISNLILKPHKLLHKIKLFLNYIR